MEDRAGNYLDPDDGHLEERKEVIKKATLRFLKLDRKKDTWLKYTGLLEPIITLLFL